MFTRGSTGSPAMHYVAAVVTTVLCLWLNRYVGFSRVTPGATMLVLILASAFFYRSGPVILTVVAGIIGVAILRPVPTWGADIVRALVFCLFGATVVAFNALRFARFDAARQYEALFDLNPLPMWVFDPQTLAFLRVNQAAIRTYGYDREEFSRMSLNDVRSPCELSQCVTDRAAQREPAFWCHRTRDGRILQVFVRSRDVMLGRRTARLALLEDVTERTALEQQLRQSQKMEAVGQLAGGIAHDFNNLLAVIQGFSTMALDSLAAGDPRRDDLREVVHASDRASELTRQLLAFSRKQLMQMRVLSMSDVVREMTPMLRRIIGETITIDIRPDSAGLARGDDGQLQQVILNLVVNARDAMGGAGRITIETADVDLDAEYSRQHPSVVPGPHVMLAVSDTGRGIDAATQARIFEPFFTTKPQGTGLGLSTVYGIVKQSGGHVWVYSEVGRGTVFKVYFPTTQEAPQTQAAKPPASRTGQSRVVLIVEDETGVRNVATRLLQRAGYVVHALEHPRRAIEMVADGCQPDVLLTDVVLPEMNGQALARTILERCPECKVVFMSGYTDTTLFESGSQPADVAFLSKPFTAASLTETLARVLDGAAAAQAAGSGKA